MARQMTPATIAAAAKASKIVEMIRMCLCSPFAYGQNIGAPRAFVKRSFTRLSKKSFGHALSCVGAVVAVALPTGKLLFSQVLFGKD
jgi:hypothetical protein